jgi:hypothetical protein
MAGFFWAPIPPFSRRQRALRRAASKQVSQIMHDLKALRDNPDHYDAGWTRRGLSPQTPALLEIDARLRAAKAPLRRLVQQRRKKMRLKPIA